MLLLTLLLICGSKKVSASRTVVDTRGMEEIGRLATVINAANCPSLLAPAPALRLQPARRRLPRAEQTHLLVTSNDAEYRQNGEKLDMSWYISHTPSTDTITLAFTSLSEPADLVDYFLDSQKVETELEPLSLVMDIDEVMPEPLVHISHLYALEDHGMPAMNVLVDVFRMMSERENQVSKVEIVGHGLGASTALLVALGLPDLDKNLAIQTTLFGLPLIGDQVFADWVESQRDPQRTIRKVTSYRDAMLGMPPHPGLVQPKLNEIWLTANPRVAHECGKSGCHVQTRGSFSDHLGPYGGVWIGSETCQSRM